MTDKQAVRQELRAWRRSISPSDRCLWDCGITLGLLRLPQYAACDTLLCYLSSPEEVATAAIVAHAICSGRQVGVPRWSNGRMEFCRFSDYNDLHPDGMGLWQPRADAVVLDRFDPATLCVVPALSVDRLGYRLGYGGGYYDRFLTAFPGFSAALCYPPAFRERLSREPHDHPVDCVVTPDYTIICKEKIL